MSTREHSQAVFLDGSLWRHVTRMSMTASIGLMAIFIVDFVDMVFISMLGNDALAAAIGYAGTILFFTNSINIGFSIAAGALVARSVGADKMAEARERATAVTLVAALAGLAVPILVVLNLDALLQQLGASGETLILAKDYLIIIVPTMSVVAVAMICMAILRAYGDARRSMMATLIGGVVNAALDPVFIFGLDLGLQGAAMASVAARFAMLFAALWPVIRQHQAFARPRLALLRNHIVAVFGMAVPAVLTNSATPVGMAIVTREMAAFGSEAVAGMAIIGRLTPVAFALVFALSGAVGPIIGQNFGADRLPRVKKSVRVSLLFVSGYVVCIAAILFLCRPLLVRLFDASGVTQELLFLFCGPLALVFIFNGAQFVANAAFNNLGHPVYSTWMNWGKNTIGTWPLVVVGAAYGGPAGLLVGQAIGTVLTGLLSLWLVSKVLRNPKHPLLVESRQFSHRMHTVATRRNW